MIEPGQDSKTVAASAENPLETAPLRDSPEKSPRKSEPANFIADSGSSGTAAKSTSGNTASEESKEKSKEKSEVEKLKAIVENQHLRKFRSELEEVEAPEATPSADADYKKKLYEAAKEAKESETLDVILSEAQYDTDILKALSENQFISQKFADELIKTLFEKFSHHKNLLFSLADLADQPSPTEKQKFIIQALATFTSPAKMNRIYFTDAQKEEINVIRRKVIMKDPLFSAHKAAFQIQNTPSTSQMEKRKERKSNGLGYHEILLCEQAEQVDEKTNPEILITLLSEAIYYNYPNALKAVCKNSFFFKVGGTQNSEIIDVILSWAQHDVSALEELSHHPLISQKFANELLKKLIENYQHYQNYQHHKDLLPSQHYEDLLPSQHYEDLFLSLAKLSHEQSPTEGQRCIIEALIIFSFQNKTPSYYSHTEYLDDATLKSNIRQKIIMGDYGFKVIIESQKILGLINVDYYKEILYEKAEKTKNPEIMDIILSETQDDTAFLEKLSRSSFISQGSEEFANKLVKKLIENPQYHKDLLSSLVKQTTSLSQATTQKLINKAIAAEKNRILDELKKIAEKLAVEASPKNHAPLQETFESIFNKLVLLFSQKSNAVKFINDKIQQIAINSDGVITEIRQKITQAIKDEHNEEGPATRPGSGFEPSGSDLINTSLNFDQPPTKASFVQPGNTSTTEPQKPGLPLTENPNSNFCVSTRSLISGGASLKETTQPIDGKNNREGRPTRPEGGFEPNGSNLINTPQKEAVIEPRNSINQENPAESTHPLDEPPTEIRFVQHDNTGTTEPKKNASTSPSFFDPTGPSRQKNQLTKTIPPEIFNEVCDILRLDNKTLTTKDRVAIRNFIKNDSQTFKETYVAILNKQLEELEEEIVDPTPDQTKEITRFKKASLEKAIEETKKLISLTEKLMLLTGELMLLTREKPISPENIKKNKEAIESKKKDTEENKETLQKKLTELKVEIDLSKLNEPMTGLEKKLFLARVLTGLRECILYPLEAALEKKTRETYNKNHPKCAQLNNPPKTSENKFDSHSLKITTRIQNASAFLEKEGYRTPTQENKAFSELKKEITQEIEGYIKIAHSGYLGCTGFFRSYNLTDQKIAEANDLLLKIKECKNRGDVISLLQDNKTKNCNNETQEHKNSKIPTFFRNIGLISSRYGKRLSECLEKAERSTSYRTPKETSLRIPSLPTP